jgi:hypothetical protein
MSSINLFSSPGQRPCELLPSGFVRRPSYVVAVVVVVVCRKLLIKADFIDNWYGDPTSHVKTLSSSSKSHHCIAPLLPKIVWRNICGPESCQFASVCLQTCKYDPAYHTLQNIFRLKSRNPPETLHMKLHTARCYDTVVQHSPVIVCRII